MERREFMSHGVCGLSAIMAASRMNPEQVVTPPAKPRRYKIEIEIFEARTDSWCHKKGDRFKYPEDWAKLCPWLQSSLHDFVLLLLSGCTLNWKYEKTPYEKVIDPDGITTEYVRCPDPTSNLVAKIIRTAV